MAGGATGHTTEPEATAAAPAAAAAVPAAAMPPAVARLLRLQGFAGNRAVSAMIARESGVTGNPQLDAVLGGGYALANGAWDVLAADPASAVRLGLEAGRMVIGPVGAVSGAASDVIGAIQDCMAVPGGDPMLWGFAEVGIVFRSVLNLVTNAIGQVTAVDNLIQDVLGSTTALATLSGLGIPVDAITVPLLGVTFTVNEAASGLKAELLLAVGGCDVLIALGAGMMALVGPKADTEEWAELAAGYTANVVGDVVSFLIEIAGLFTGGIAQGGILGTFFESFEQFLKILAKLSGGLMQWIQGVWNVLGGKAIGNPFENRPDEGLTPTAGATLALSRDASGSAPDPAWSALVAELEAVQACVFDGDGRVADMGAALQELVEGASEGIAELSGGLDPLAMMKDAMSDALTDMEGRLGMLDGIDGAVAGAHEGIASGVAGLDTAIATLQGVAFPTITVETGQDVLDALLAPIRSMFEEMKQALLAPLLEAQLKAAELTELVNAFGESARLQRETLEGMVTGLRAAVENADGLPELIMGLIDELTRASTQGEVSGWDGIVAEWQGLGPMVGDALGQARARAAG